MATPLRNRVSRVAGWLADRRVPGFLRKPVYGTYCALTGANGGEAQLAYRYYPSLGAFFVRRLQDGARSVVLDQGLLPSPCDGRLQAVGAVERGRALQAKGVDYELEDLLAGAAEGCDLERAVAWTIYLSPRDYHRVHAPLAGTLERVFWVPGDRRSVAPRGVGRRPGLFAGNERAVLRLATPHGPYLLVMVGALNVGRIRVVGVEPGAQPPSPAPAFARGEEIARFEMGSTVVLVLPRALGFTPLTTLELGAAVRLGEPIGETAGA